MCGKLSEGIKQQCWVLGLAPCFYFSRDDFYLLIPPQPWREVLATHSLPVLPSSNSDRVGVQQNVQLWTELTALWGLAALHASKEQIWRYLGRFAELMSEKVCTRLRWGMPEGLVQRWTEFCLRNSPDTALSNGNNWKRHEMMKNEGISRNQT